jgi:NADPH:quinone reductase-like Zn-dependent oxidoreductase
MLMPITPAMLAKSIGPRPTRPQQDLAATLQQAVLAARRLLSPHTRDGVEAGKLTPLVGRTYPLGEGPEAMRALDAGSTRGKLVITV